MKKFLIGLAIIFFLSSHAYALEVPVLQGRVNDYANELTPQQVSELEARLKQEEDATTNQIVILTIPSLEGEDLKEFTIRVATTWGIGQKGKDNGVLILRSKGDRKIRIEVGKGLEGSLTDARSSEIIRNTIAPNFKSGNTFAGYSGAISEITSSIRGEFKPTEKTEGENAVTGFIVGLIILFFICGFIGIIIHDTVGGFVGGLGAPFINSITIHSGEVALFFFLIIGFIVGLIAASFLRAMSGSGSGDSGGFWDSSSSSGGGGGFSGGGGDFGGGGADGDA